MSEFRRRLLIQNATKGSGGDYTLCEWIGSDDKAYIDTSIVVKDNGKIEASFMNTKHITYGGFFGDYIAENIDTTRIILAPVTNGRILSFNTVPKKGGTSQGGILNNVIYTYIINKDVYEIIIYDTDKIIARNDIGYYSNDNNNSSLRIFRPNLSNMRDIGARCYGFKYYEDSILIKDFIPVLDANGIPCMYEKVEGKFYYNKGEGEFTYQLKQK